MRAPQIGIAQLVQDFFLRRLVAQRGASARTVEAYRDAFELLLGFAEQRTGKPPSALALPDLDAPLVLDFLDHLETERGRYLMRLELRALATAMLSNGRARRIAVKDALSFRMARLASFAEAPAAEAGLDRNEGLASYTGVRLGAGDQANLFAARTQASARKAGHPPTSCPKRTRRGLRPLPCVRPRISPTSANVSPSK